MSKQRLRIDTVNNIYRSAWTEEYDLREVLAFAKDIFSERRDAHFTLIDGQGVETVVNMAHAVAITIEKEDESL